jgi:hypothetical protein
VMARTGTGRACRDWTPVPAERVGAFDVRLLASPPQNTTLRVELPDGQNWQRTGTTTIRYAGWAPLRRNYEIGLALLVTVLLCCSLPSALAALRSVPVRWHRRSARSSRPRPSSSCAGGEREAAELGLVSEARRCRDGPLSG